MRYWLKNYIGPASDGVFYRPVVFYGWPTPGQVLVMALNPTTPIYDLAHKRRLPPGTAVRPSSLMSSDQYLDILLDGKQFEREYRRIRPEPSKTHRMLLELINAIKIPVALSNYYRYPTAKASDLPESEKVDDHVMALMNKLRPALFIALCDDASDFIDDYLHAEPAANCRPEYLEYRFKQPPRHIAYERPEDWNRFCRTAAEKARELGIRP